MAIGRPPKLGDSQRAELVKVLKANALAAGLPTELWTVPRVATLIKDRFGVKPIDPSVWRMLQQLGWSGQRPAGHTRQRGERAVHVWKEKK